MLDALEQLVVEFKAFYGRLKVKQGTSLAHLLKPEIEATMNKIATVLHAQNKVILEQGEQIKGKDTRIEALTKELNELKAQVNDPDTAKMLAVAAENPLTAAAIKSLTLPAQ